MGGPNPIPGGPVRTRGGPGPILEIQAVYLGVQHFPMGVRTHCRCLGVYHFLWTRGNPGPARVVGSGAVADPE
jgi:hypothetical protein